jgi:hypothetical protein
LAFAVQLDIVADPDLRGGLHKGPSAHVRGEAQRNAGPLIHTPPLARTWSPRRCLR